jgi:hypothetical protein
VPSRDVAADVATPGEPDERRVVDPKRVEQPWDEISQGVRVVVVGLEGR